ncbi:MAG: hypothetical protein HRT44_13535 [Bdellovibrionales bacterium]|nr:hypothetical protein [Bdellovibrionales bacterium]
MELVQQQISHSLASRDEVKAINPKKRSQFVLKNLKRLKNSLQQESRRKAVSDLIQAYNSNNTRLFKKRLSGFDKEERRFFKVAQHRLNKIKSEYQFYLFLAGLLPLIGFFILFYYFNFGILSPLQSLSNRMMEFLLDQYTFRFSHPPNNEIGNLERTFNSLAQKVLNNMDELKALDRAKSEFVSIASHELRTPLTSIKGSLGLLSNEIVGKMDDEAKDMVSVAEQETDRLVRLINDMLDIAKIESRSLTLKKQWSSIKQLVKQTAQGLQGFASAAKVHIQIVEPIRELEVFMDADRIQQVMTNLISNAIKYSPEDGSVAIEYNILEEEKIVISIIDQGPGISGENQALIFEKFRQATDSSSHLVKGTGLGLAISKALVEEHEGAIGVESTLGEGSTFYFSLSQWRYFTGKLDVADKKVAS